jgi:phasin family protein
LLRYINAGFVQGLGRAGAPGFKCFILLHFGNMVQRGQCRFVQRTKIPLTRGLRLPRMKLLRRTNRGARRTRQDPRRTAMATVANPLSELSTATVDAATRLTRISMDSTERAIAVQLEYAKGALSQASLNAKALAGARDVQELMALRTRIAENALENIMGYSRSLYEVASEAQSELSKLAEERMSSFQKAVTETVDQAAKSAPAGGDLAAAAIKSSLAATTAAFDTFSKAAKHAASFADAGVRGAGNGKTRK